MWTRAEIKKRAKNVLRGSYWSAFLVSLVIGMVGGSSNGGSGFQYRKSVQNFDPNLLRLILIIGVVVVIIAILVRILVGYALEVGGRKYFIKAAEADVNLSRLGYAFKSNIYGKITITMLYRSVLLILWTLLLIIPGIIMSYAYRMVPYILADNPDIGTKRAIELSVEMTRGEKFEIWVLDLSFLGWYLLGTLAFLIGVIFVRPYDDSTNAELYLILRKNALDSGLCTPEELNMNNGAIGGV